MTAGERVAARAGACLGVRFRPQGSDPAFGLDCVGLAAWAFDVAVAADHPMRCGDPARVASGVSALGLLPVAGDRAGDLLLFETGPGQLHLAVRSHGGIIHADAAARRVVERPGAPAWPVLAAWRKAGQGEG